MLRRRRRHPHRQRRDRLRLQLDQSTDCSGIESDSRDLLVRDGNLLWRYHGAFDNRLDTDREPGLIAYLELGTENKTKVAVAGDWTGYEAIS